MDERSHIGKSLSMRSVRSAKYKSAFECNKPDEKPLDLDDFMAMACKKFACPCNIVVKKEAQHDDHSKMYKNDSTLKQKRISIAPVFSKQTATPDSGNDSEESASKSTVVDDNAIIITALYDNFSRLAEIVIEKTTVPRLLIQLLGLITPHYQQLTKLVIKKCRITAYTVHELSKFLPLTAITDICLDDSPVAQGNYALLLESQAKLSNLSLCRCSINDEVCKLIASKLNFLEPAEATLSTLNLSSNHITDDGAKYLGEALRNNRHLRYLNLADNRITDEGANHIFHALIDFPLTYDEIMAKRRRCMAYLKTKRAVYLKYLTQCDSKSIDDFSTMSKRSAKKSLAGSSLKNKTKRDKLKTIAADDDFMQVRAEMMANELIGPFVDPFLPSFIKLVNGYCHCVGNMVLCYLNLCYNNLTYLSLKKLQKVLFYQSVKKAPNETGLMRVLLEGNPLPLACNEMERINEMLHRNVVNFSGKYVSNKQKMRARISVIQERK